MKLKRVQIQNLCIALNICKQLSVPAKFRYAIKVNLDAMASEVQATMEAFPEPEKAEDRERWEKDLKVHMEEEVEVALHKTDLPEINDDVNIPVDGPERRRQNQALVEALSPILHS